MVRSARASMTPDQIEDLENAGEYMYGQIDFETSTSLEPSLELRVAVESLKSGLSPDYLTDSERELLKQEYGENWLQKVLNIDEFDFSFESVSKE